MTHQDYKTHFKNNYEKRISTFLSVDYLKKISLLLFATLLYGGFALYGITKGNLFSILILTIALVSGVIFLLSWVYTNLKSQKSKDILAYHLFKASEFYHCYEVEPKENQKQEFLKKSLKQISKFGKTLKTLINEMTITLELPDIIQIKELQKNTMARIYPFIKDGKNTEEDILLAISKLFFYEVEYDKLPEFNQTLKQELPYKEFNPEKEKIFTRIKNNPVIKCIVADFSVIFVVFFGNYFLKYPIDFTEYWTYIGGNAATIIGTIVAPSIAIDIYILSRNKKK